MKLTNALQADIDAAVKVLLDLKAQFKAATGKDWKPGMAVPTATGTPETSAPAAGGGGEELNNKIKAQGDSVRDLKSQKAPKVRNLVIAVLD